MNERARFRKMAGLTQGQLGRRVGKSAGTICQWERGELELQPAVVEKIYRQIEAELQKQFERLFDLMQKGDLDSVIFETAGRRVDFRAAGASA